MYVPKIKSFFYKTPEKTEEMTGRTEIAGAREEEENVEDYSLQDI